MGLGRLLDQRTRTGLGESDKILHRLPILRLELGAQLAMRRVQYRADTMRRFHRPRHRIARAPEPGPQLGQFGRLTQRRVETPQERERVVEGRDFGRSGGTRIEPRSERVESNHAAGACGERVQHRGDCANGRSEGAVALVVLAHTRAQFAGRKRVRAAAQRLQQQRVDDPARAPTFFHRVGAAIRNPKRRAPALPQPFVHPPRHRRGVHQLDRQKRTHTAVDGIFLPGRQRRAHKFTHRCHSRRLAGQGP